MSGSLHSQNSNEMNNFGISSPQNHQMNEGSQFRQS
jgi:hypothetical protein